VDTLQKQGKAFDDVASELAGSYPHILGTEDPAQALFELLGAGLPEYRYEDDIWGEALTIHRSGGSGAPEYDDEELARELRGETSGAVPFSMAYPQ
jgi:hypothetical protein